jgi:hypothetical protein
MKYINKLFKILENLNIKVLIFFIFLFNFLVLSDTLLADYFGDDLYNFQIPGLFPYQYSGPGEYSLKSVLGWLNAGRVFPFSGYHAYLFEIAKNSILVYKSILLFLILLNISLFSYLTYLISKSKSLALWVLSITALMFQYRYYHDPILSFHGLLQFLFLYTTLALIFLKKYIDSGRFSYYIASLLFFVISLMTYEISYSFILLYVPIALTLNKDKFNITKIINILLPYGLLTLSLVLIVLYIRSSIQMGDIYTPNTNLFPIIKTYFLQTISVLPTSYYFNFGSIPELSNLLDIVFLAITVLFFMIFFTQVVNDNINDEAVMIKQSIIFAILLMFLPGSLISLSAKFQGLEELGGTDMNTVQFGLAYLPIYIQVFGLSLLISIGLCKVRGISFKSFAIFILLSFILSVHYFSNKQVIYKVNTPYKDSREVLTLFFSEDFNDYLNSGDTILLKGVSPIHSRAFVSMVSNKDITVHNSEDKGFKYKINYDVNNKEVMISVKNNENKWVSTYIYLKRHGEWVSTKELIDEDAENITSIIPTFTNFYNLEAGDLRWATSNPSVTLFNLKDFNLPQRLTFEVNSINDRKVEIILNGEKIDSFELGKSTYSFDQVLILNPGENIIKINSHEPPINPQGADERLLLLSLKEFSLISKE